MPTDIVQDSIYNDVIVIANSKNDYTVYDAATQTVIQTGITDVDTALEIKSAYCKGYNAGYAADKSHD